MYNYIDEVPEEIQEQADAYFNHEDALSEREEQTSNKVGNNKKINMKKSIELLVRIACWIIGTDTGFVMFMSIITLWIVYAIYMCV